MSVFHLASDPAPCGQQTRNSDLPRAGQQASLFREARGFDNNSTRIVTDAQRRRVGVEEFTQQRSSELRTWGQAGPGAGVLLPVTPFALLLRPMGCTCHLKHLVAI